MSSSKFSTELTPDPRLRRVVIIAALTTLLLGLTTILTSSTNPLLRVVAAACWLAFSCRELLVISAAYKHCRRIRVSSGGAVEIVGQEGSWRAATLQSGSVVLSELAWLRIETDDGRKVVELLRGNCRKNKEWRRLQVIWRHLGGSP